MVPTTNRLIREHSPYLRQHARNPVDWHPWGPEALEKSRREDKPIFLSIGYSTCHWCHVMERESFENEDLARILNDHFIPVKVDREERPDLDNLYMTAVQGMTGSGGWPMTVVLTPDLKPFFAGTYFPPEDAGGHPGLRRVLLALQDAWTSHRADVDQTAEHVAEFLRAESARAGAGEPEPGETASAAATAATGATATEAGVAGAAAIAVAAAGRRLPGRDLLDAAFARLRAAFDPDHGGFGGAPKFPTPHQISFLLHYWARTGQKQALEMARLTLHHMARGGIHDHLGGGFHRYSTDAEWLAPHFEKMLYDQALLAETYIEAWQATSEPEFAAVARDTCDYVLRDLLDPQGGFYTAEDADSEGEEGRFYVWTEAEVREVQGEDDAARFVDIYDVTERGNWEGRNILRLQQPLRVWSDRLGVPLETLQLEMSRARSKLLQARGRRVRPLRDDKVLAGWNGLMIGAMARAGAALDEPRYLEAAAQAADFVERAMVRDGRLLRRWHDGSADVPAYLEDYAYLCRGLLDLYEAGFDPRHLRRSRELAEDMERLFKDPGGGGGYLFSGRGNEELLAPHKDVYDGALPSANSVAAGALLRLGELLADATLASRGRALLEAFAPTIPRAPQAYTEMLQAVDFELGPRTEITLAGSPADRAMKALIRTVHETFLPNKVVAFHATDPEQAAQVEALIPYTTAQPAEGGPTAYVCRNYTCRLPVHSSEDLQRELAEARAPNRAHA